MNTEEFLKYSYDPVLIGFYKAEAKLPEEEIEINTTNFRKKLKYIKKKYPNSAITGFWCNNNRIIANALINET